MSEGQIRQIGTPQDLYERPNHPDVADFMGFRTRIPGRLISVSGGRAAVEAGGGTIEGIAAENISVGERVLVSIRPEDLVAIDEGDGLKATVNSIEYRGRAFFGLATGTDGSQLFFRADRTHPRGAAIVLRPLAESTLLFKEKA
jgi:putative spermidine/putrescine transport system ATP-binding protein